MTATGNRESSTAASPPWGSYLLSLLLPLLLLIVVAAVALQRLQGDINFTLSKRDSLQDISGLYQEVLLLQQMRGLDQLVVQGSNSAVLDSRIGKLEQHFSEGLNAWIKQSHSRNSGVVQQLANLNFQLLSRSTLPRDTDVVSRFAWFTHHIEGMQLSITHLAFDTGLLLDTEQESYLLADMLISHLPALTEAQGSLRGVTAGLAAKGGSSRTDQEWFEGRVLVIEERLQDLEHVWRLLSVQAPKQAIALQQQLALVTTTSRELIDSYIVILASGGSDYTQEELLQLFDEGSHAISITAQFYGGISARLAQLFDERIATLQRERLLLMISGVMVLLTILYLARGFIRGSRRVMEALLQGEGRQRAVQRIAGVGYWNWDLQRRELEWSPELYGIFGWEPVSFPPEGERLVAAIHPDDQQRVRLLLIEVLRSYVRDYRTEYRIVREDGTIRHLIERGEVLRDAAARPVRMIGAVLDITEYRMAGADGMRDYVE